MTEEGEIPMRTVRTAKMLRSPPALLFASVVCVAAAVGLSGLEAGLGMAAGLSGSAANLWGLHLVAGMLLPNPDGAADPRSRVLISAFVFLVKLPILLGLGFLMLGVGAKAYWAFLTGLLLVYCWLVGWALARR